MNTDEPGPLAPLRGDEPDLYRDHQPRLLALLRGALGAREQTLEDACPFAWVNMMVQSVAA